MTHYDTLGVSKMATPDQISSAYRKMMRSYHPDINPNGGEKATQITAAYAVLSDSFKRRDYDRSIQPVTSPPLPRAEPVTVVAEPVSFSTPQPAVRYARRGAFAFIRTAWESNTGKILLSLSAASFIAWAVSLTVGFTTLGGLALGLASFTVFLLAFSLVIFLVNPIRHPYVAIALFILVFALPLDYLNGDGVLPNLLAGLNPATALALCVAFLSAIATRFFISNTRRFAAR